MSRLFLDGTYYFYIYSNYYSGGGLGSSGIRFKKEFLGKVPLPHNFNDEFICFFFVEIQKLTLPLSRAINKLF